MEEAGSAGDGAEEWEAEVGMAWAWVQDNVVNPKVEQAEPFFTLFPSSHVPLLLISNCRRTYNLCTMSYNRQSQESREYCH